MPSSITVVRSAVRILCPEAGGAAAGLATMIIPLLILDSFIMITPGVAGDQGAVVPAW